MDTPAPTTEARETFLAHFQTAKRGTIANWFLYPVRAQGATTPHAVVTCVVTMLRDRVARAHKYGYDLNDADEQIAIIASHEDEALGFAAWAIAWEQLPAAEREAIKQSRREEHKNAWMAEHPPSDKQLGYLQRLGYIGPPPASMQEASAAIDRILRRKGGQR